MKKFRSCRVGLIRNSGNTRLKIIEDTLDQSNEEISEWFQIQNPNELLHLASLYGDIFHMLYALALDADKNSIIDQVYTKSIKSESNGEQTHHNEYNNKGHTPLIKAVISVPIFNVSIFMNILK